MDDDDELKSRVVLCKMILFIYFLIGNCKIFNGKKRQNDPMKCSVLKNDSMKPSLTEVFQML